MKFRLGITGGIGSGKSTICKVFEVLGITVFYSDDEARLIMDNNRSIRSQLNELLDLNIFPGGKLDRPLLAGLIFNDKELLQKVNKLVHPIVFETFDKWSEEQSGDYVILESALLFESKSDWRVDKVLAVVAPMEERIARVMQRNSMKRDEVLERIRNQVSENEMVRKSDFIIDNSDSSMILPSVTRTHNEIISLLNRI